MIEKAHSRLGMRLVETLTGVHRRSGSERDFDKATELTVCGPACEEKSLMCVREASTVLEHETDVVRMEALLRRPNASLKSQRPDRNELPS